MKRCEELCELLPKATVIHGDAANHDLLMEEGIHEADALIALTGMDEENIIMALFAKLQGVNKIVAKVNEDSRAQMVEGLGIDSIVSAKSATADAIMSYVRARNESASNVNLCISSWVEKWKHWNSLSNANAVSRMYRFVNCGQRRII